jgi:hypothetical protein
MAEKILTAIANSPFAWKGLVPNSFKAMNEFRTQQNVNLYSKIGEDSDQMNIVTEEASSKPYGAGEQKQYKTSQLKIKKVAKGVRNSS